MSGYVPRRVASTRTAMGTTDQRTAGSGSVMLGLVGSVGRRNSVWRAIQRKTYVSMRQKNVLKVLQANVKELQLLFQEFN